MTREEAIKVLENATIEPTWGGSFRATSEALDMAIEALKREDHDGCDGCRYEANHELSLPCVGCKQNYVDKYVPMPEHDREWIIGCIKHDGFVKTDRGDKANQIILDALSADNTSTNTSTKSTNISTDTSADRPRGEWISVNKKLPDDGKWAIWCNNDGVIEIARFKEDCYNHFYPNGTSFELEDAVAWMPLPEPYKGGEDK